MSGTLAPSTPTNRRLAGTTAFAVNGTAISVIEFTWDPAVFENSTMTSLSGVDGFDQKPVAPYISGKFRDTGANSVTSLHRPDQRDGRRAARERQTNRRPQSLVCRPSRRERSRRGLRLPLRGHGRNHHGNWSFVMIPWTPVPEPQAWPLPKPMMHNGVHYAKRDHRGANLGGCVESHIRFGRVRTGRDPAHGRERLG